MLQVLTGLRNFIKLDKVCIDNSVFKLHYKLTTGFLLVFCILSTSRQFLGTPIECSIEGVEPEMGNLYCWITSTYTIPNRVGENVPHPGVSYFDPSSDQLKLHKYYQWTGLFLLFQAILFYSSHYVWKLCEGGRVKALTGDLKSYDEKILDEKVKTLREYFDKNIFLHTSYYTRFVICETFNLINVILQMFLIDWFLNFEFYTYGWNVLSFTTWEQAERLDPMSRIFPKVAKCSFNKYGPSGTMETRDGLCILPINVINEKIYIFLWFWLLLLSAMSFAALIMRILNTFSRRFRYFTFISKYGIAEAKDVKYLSYRMGPGDWFMLTQVAKNLDALVLKKLITELAVSFRDEKKTEYHTARTSKTNWNLDIEWKAEKTGYDTYDSVPLRKE